MERLQGILALESSKYSDVIGYALWIAIALIGLVIGRLIVRSVVNKRVHGVTEMGVTFGDLKSMQDKGLVSEAEYKTMRRRMAQRELREIREAEEQGRAGDVLLTVEANPGRAGELIGQGSATARASLANLTEVRAEAKIDHDLYFGSTQGATEASIEDQLREQLGVSSESSAESSAEASAGPSARQSSEPASQPSKSGGPASMRPAAAHPEAPAAPSAIMAEADAPESRPASTAKPPAKSPAEPKAIDPLEAHITRAPRRPQRVKPPAAPVQPPTPTQSTPAPPRSQPATPAAPTTAQSTPTKSPAAKPPVSRTANASAASKSSAATTQPRASKPRRSAPAPAPPPTSAADGRRDLDVLLERGHLSREEYDRLAAIIDQTERDRQLSD